VRAAARGRVQGVGLRDAVVARAGELGVLGWIRHAEQADRALLHAEGGEQAVGALVEFLREGPAGAEVEDVESEAVEPEGHEQFAVRGVGAGSFEVVAADATAGFELRLEVGGAIRGWALPKEPSMDPAVKRIAFALDPEEGTAEAGEPWDRGPYEQGGRVAWPEAIERGHAVFVLHGAQLAGGFALQRLRQGARPQWLLIKRNDEHARRGRP